MSSQVSFKQAHSLQDRIQQFKKVIEHHPNKIPVIVERASQASRSKSGSAASSSGPGSSSAAGNAASSIPDIDKNKYLVPGDLTVAQFLCLIRKRIKLSNDQALFIYVKGTLPATSAMFSTIYAECKDEDGFLYVQYTGESSFGN